MDDAAATPTTRRIVVGADHPAFDGHFPGRPVLPGVAVLALVLEAIADDPVLAGAVGPAPRLPVIKFAGAVAPSTTLAITLVPCGDGVDFRVAIEDGGTTAASGRVERAP